MAPSVDFDAGRHGPQDGKRSRSFVGRARRSVSRRRPATVASATRTVPRRLLAAAVAVGGRGAGAAQAGAPADGFIVRRSAAATRLSLMVADVATGKGAKKSGTTS